MCGHGRHHHGECGCHEGRHGGHHEGCECDCRAKQECDCGCHEGEHEGANEIHFERRFTTRAERSARLEEYLKDLQTEVQAVQEQIAAMKAVSA